MRHLAVVAIGVAGILHTSYAAASTSCDARDLVIVELDLVKNIEVMKVNEHPVKGRDSFEVFFKNCARKTVILASPRAKLSQILDIQVFLGKIGARPKNDNFFIFSASPESGAMTYMGTFATMKYTRKHDELIKLIESPPEESNWF
ncbi:MULTISPECIES: hypothetical protein [unclassified Xanthomonas]|uniref:hypothetical protein n=1 Tax=unclassified Xanthomonas TaxID=2643310 RepID=UPI002166F317|nr:MULTISPECIES: hypothetical protein [unclassified Xanthomonas]MCS3744982.1 hypothetical protein [Xanthomonas sp. 3793]MCS3807182.1 hypothetical protein [Xanthomonas sp. 4461]